MKWWQTPTPIDELIHAAEIQLLANRTISSYVMVGQVEVRDPKDPLTRLQLLMQDMMNSLNVLMLGGYDVGKTLDGLRNWIGGAPHEKYSLDHPVQQR